MTKKQRKREIRRAQYRAKQKAKKAAKKAARRAAREAAGLVPHEPREKTPEQLKLGARVGMCGRVAA